MFRTSRLIFAGCTVAVWVGLSGPLLALDATPASEASALDARIIKLIGQLGDSQYHAREKAQDELRRIGPAAFDALLAAQEHEDIEIAMRARYLVRSLPIVWTKDEDPAEVKQLFKGYSDGDRGERHTRAQHFATLDKYAGTAALCRIMRYDADRVLSKKAAVLILQAPWPESAEQREQLVKLIRSEVAASQRPSAQWLHAYARTLEAPTSTLAEWDRITAAELDLLAKNPQQSSREIARDLLRWQTQLLLRANREDEAYASVRRAFALIGNDRQDLYEILDWCVERNLHRMAEELAQRFAAQFREDAQLLYRLAESQLKRGQGETANATALQARQLMPENTPHHAAMGVTLQGRLLTDWAEQEFRHVVSRTKPEDRIGAPVRWALAELLFDWGKELAAAEVTQELFDAGAKNPQLYEQPGVPEPNSVQGYVNYYFGMHFARSGDRAKQIEYFRKAIEASPTNSDFLIAMYRVPDPDEAWKQETHKRIQALSGRLRGEIRNNEEFLQRSMDDEQRKHYGEELAQKNNELAWLLSNTAGDYQDALHASERSLELKPDSAPYLDTLGRCYYALGDFENAVKFQTRAVQKMRSNQELHSSYHVMLRQLALFEKALADSKAKKN
jgi:tetratricopeptide (TPR) repeat protein